MSSSVKGLNELLKKLEKIEKVTAKKHLRSAAMFATSPTWKQMKAAAPRGTKAHRTHTGKLVAPGYLSRSVKRVVSFKGGRFRVSLGVKRDAFYGITFLDEGSKNNKAHNWFKSTFESSSNNMALRFRDKLRARIEAAAR